MTFYVVKILLAALIIVIVTEVGKTNPVLGGLIKAIPYISVISIIWLWVETRDTQIIADLSLGTLWFVLPTLPFFLFLWLFLNKGLSFPLSLLLSLGIMLACFFIFVRFLRYLGIQI